MVQQSLKIEGHVNLMLEFSRLPSHFILDFDCFNGQKAQGGVSRSAAPASSTGQCPPGLPACLAFNCACTNLMQPRSTRIHGKLLHSGFY